MATAQGSSTIFAANPSNMIMGDRLELSSNAFGNAPSPEFSTATSLVDGTIQIDNLAAIAATISFDLLWAISSDSNAPEPAGFATSSARIQASSTNTVHLDQTVSSLSLLGDGLVQLGPTTTSFALTVGAGNSDALDLSLVVDGFAEVPEPSTCAILLGLAGAMGITQRRR